MEATPPAAPPARIEDYALSVLLHDIGKFWERSSDAPRPSPAELQLFCPHVTETGAFTHFHAALSGRFIEDAVGIPGAGRWGPKHHQPDPASREETCASIADLLVAGDLEPDESRDAPNAASAALHAVGSLPQEGAPAEPRLLPLVRLDTLPDSLVPKAVVPLSREDYRFHWNHFLAALDKIGGRSADLRTWAALLEVFASRIPAAATNRQHKTIPDVDISSHSRAVAAVAVGLLLGPLSQAELLALRAQVHGPGTGKLDLPLVRLLAAEIVGLDGFLALDGAGPEATEFLRGRALFLDLLADGCARRLAALLRLPATSVLHRSGGRFILLAPANASWEAARDELDEVLAGAAGGELGLEAAVVPLTLSDFRAGLGRPWAGLEEDLDDAIGSRIPRLARRSYERIFGPVDEAAARGDGLREAVGRFGRALAGARFIVRARTVPTPHVPPEGTVLSPLVPPEGTVPPPLVPPEGTVLSPHVPPEGTVPTPLGPPDPPEYLCTRDGTRTSAVSAGWPKGAIADLVGEVEAFGPEAIPALAARDDIEAVWSLGRLDLEELGRIAAGRFRTLGWLPWPAGTAGAAESLAVGPPAVLTAGADGLRRMVGIGLPAGGSSLPRILAALGAARLFFSGWIAADLAGVEAGPIIPLGSTAGGIMIAGSFRALEALAGRLPKAFSMVPGLSGLTLSIGLDAGGSPEETGDVLRSTRAGLEAARCSAAAPKGGAASAAGRISFLGADLAFEDLPALRDDAVRIAALFAEGGRAAEDALRALAAEAPRRREVGDKEQPPVERDRAAGLSEVRESVRRKRRESALVAGLDALGRILKDDPVGLEGLRAWLLADASERTMLPLVLRWAELLRKGEGR
jgi:hypothetical protein